MTARQQHGFDYQEDRIKYWKLKNDENYGAKQDAWSSDAHLESEQIKCIKLGCRIELADYWRNKEKEDKDDHEK